MRREGDTLLAVTITAESLHTAIGADLDMATRLLEFATERVMKIAPLAPDAAQNEAVIRYAGYMAQSDYGGIRKEVLGPKETEYQMNHANAWRNSGAAGILAPWATKRAGVI